MARTLNMYKIRFSSSDCDNKIKKSKYNKYFFVMNKNIIQKIHTEKHTQIMYKNLLNAYITSYFSIQKLITKCQKYSSYIKM